MRTLTAIGLAALLVTLGACGGGDDDKPQQPVPEVPVTPEPEQPVTPDPVPPVPERKPLVEGPFWPSMYSEVLAVSYEDPAPNEVKFRGMLKALSSSHYTYQKDLASEVEVLEGPCSFDPAGLRTSDPSRPATLTIKDQVFYDPTTQGPSPEVGRTLYRNQFFHEAYLTSGSIEKVGTSMRIVVHYAGENEAGESQYGVSALILYPNGGWLRCP